MKASIATALRANVVLFTVSTGIAIVPCLSFGLLLGVVDADMPALPYQGAIFLLAAPIMLMLRWCARLAFDSATRAHKVQLHEEQGLDTLIADDCPFAWLVQLHLELHGHHCGD